MGQAMQVTSGFATNPGAAITALTASTGDTFTVPTFDPSSTGKIMRVWVGNAAGGILRLRSPRLHDPAQGLRLRVPAADQVQLLGGPELQPLYPADPLIVEMSGGGAEVDILSYLTYYNNVPGLDAPLQTWAAVKDRITNLAGVELNMTSGATAGQYGGARALNQDFQNLRAGENYALLGYTVSTAFATLGVTGPDTGKVRVAGPGSTNSWDTASWFADLSSTSGLPTIPVLQANNAGATVVDMIDAATATNRPITLILGEMPS